MYETMMAVMRRYMRSSLQRRADRIEDEMEHMEKTLLDGKTDAVYERLSIMAQHVELLGKDLRESMICFHGDLQTVGFLPQTQPYPLSKEVDISMENGCVCLKMAAILPFPSHGSVYYIHEQAEKSLANFIAENNLLRPLYTEQCAVVFLHHYDFSNKAIRHLRDYDNVEHRCITNILAANLLWGDSPKCMIGMDVLVPEEQNFTEIRIMPMDKFREFAAIEK